MNYITDERITPYKIGLDENQFHLIEECISQTGNNIGNRYEITKGYFRTMGAVLDKIAYLKSIESNYDSVEGYISTLKRMYIEIVDALRVYLNDDE